MGTDGMGMVGSQDGVDGGDPQIGRDGGGSWPKKLNDRSLIPNITKDATLQPDKEVIRSLLEISPTMTSSLTKRVGTEFMLRCLGRRWVLEHMLIDQIG